jgi:hypothetical protein
MPVLRPLERDHAFGKPWGDTSQSRVCCDNGDFFLSDNKPRISDSH